MSNHKLIIHGPPEFYYIHISDEDRSISILLDPKEFISALERAGYTVTKKETALSKAVSP